MREGRNRGGGGEKSGGSEGSDYWYATPQQGHRSALTPPCWPTPRCGRPHGPHWHACDGSSCSSAADGRTASAYGVPWHTPVVRAPSWSAAWRGTLVYNMRHAAVQAAKRAYWPERQLFTKCILSSRTCVGNEGKRGPRQEYRVVCFQAGCHPCGQDHMPQAGREKETLVRRGIPKGGGVGAPGVAKPRQRQWGYRGGRTSGSLHTGNIQGLAALGQI